jgi:hypothetical protein
MGRAVQFQSGREAQTFRQSGLRGGAVDGVLAHAAVGGPLAAGQGDQPAVADADDVVARQALGVGALGGFHQGAQAHVHAADVRAGGGGVHVLRGGAQDEVDFLGQRAGFEAGLGDGGVGGADHDVVVPGHGEQHAAVVGAGHHDGAVAGQEAAVHDDVHALTGGEHGLDVAAFHAADVVHEHAGGVHHGPGTDLVFAASLVVAEAGADDAAALLDQAHDGGVVQGDAAMVFQAAHERDGQPRVVELPVEVEDAALQPGLFQGGGAGQRLGLVHVAAGLEVQLPGEQVVHLQADAVEGRGPPLVRGDQEAHVAHEVRGVAFEQAAFVQCLAHQGHVALREVAHAAVHEFGRAAAGALGVVVRFEQQGAVAARGRFHGGTQARGAAPDDENVPGFGRGGGGQGGLAGVCGHGVNLPCGERASTG